MQIGDKDGTEQPPARQMPPLQLHTTQSYKGNHTQQPVSVPLPAVVISPGLKINSVGPRQLFNGPNNDNSNETSGVRGIFNLRCTLPGPLAKIYEIVECALKNRAIVLHRTTDVRYNCEYQGLRFEIIIEHAEGHLHTIKFKRLEGNWWTYKKLTVALTDDFQDSQAMTR
ncbi:hypothetical protein GGH13_002400 [Coemansia sp. S155-1]|nr:hypothetical protein GGH13_002400 [Coemansia sp. S155-1]